MKAGQDKLAEFAPQPRPKKTKRKKKGDPPDVDELQETLPDGWAVEIDAASGKPYFWCEEDPENSVTWTHPNAAAVAESPPSLPASPTAQASASPEASEAPEVGVGMTAESAVSYTPAAASDTPAAQEPPASPDLKQGGAE